MNKDGRSNLYAALAAAQGEMENASLNRENPHFKSKYADLASIRDATIPALSKNGLALIQYTEATERGLLLHTRLAHTSGEYIESTYPVIADLSKPHPTGSALTYAKRYSWAAICGISADEDDDGNAKQDETKGATKRAGETFTSGPLGKTALKEKLRQFVTELADVEDDGQLAGLLHVYDAALIQGRKDLIKWMEGDADTMGIDQRISLKTDEIEAKKDAV